MDSFLGMIGIFGFNFAPRAWAFCGGQLIAISQNTALFSLLGTTFGGDGRTTFALPNLVSRAPYGYNYSNNSQGLTTYPWGHMRGQQLHTMSTAELPNHAHMATFTGTGGGGGTPASVAVSETPAKEKVVSAGDYLASDSALGGVSKFVQPADVGTTVPLGGVTGGGGITGGTVTVQGAGNSQSFPVQSPALFVNYSICIAGIYPSRN